MKIHELKIWPEYFQPTLEQKKEFEVRRNDREFSIGDILKLNEFDPWVRGAPKVEGKFTGRTILAKVESLFQCVGLKDGFCVMDIKVVASNCDLEAKL